LALGLIILISISFLLFIPKGKKLEENRRSAESGKDLEKRPEVTVNLKKGGEAKMSLLGTKALFVLAPKNFRDEEYQEPRKILEEYGAKIEVAAKGVKIAEGVMGVKIAVDKELSEVQVENYQAIIFVGGPGSSIYFDDTVALNLAKKAVEEGKIVGAICIAPSILGNSGVLAGKRATAFSSEAGTLRAKGADYTGALVEVDGKIVTASGPEAAREFGQKIAEKLRE
jgi:protease I